MRIAIGQYVPGTSALHRADPRTKFVLTFAYMVVVMIADNYAAYLAAALYLGAAYVCARINVGKILRSLRPLIIMMVLTALLNLFFLSTFFADISSHSFIHKIKFNCHFLLF